MPFKVAPAARGYLDQPSSASHDFADREEESRALASSVEFMTEVLRGGREINAFHHVLTFYGGGGVGKSALSMRLQAWLQSELHDDHWGPAPAVPNVSCVRWDLNRSQGDIDTVSMMMSLRAALPPIPEGWKFFDMALLSFIQAARPGEDLKLQTGNAKHGETLANAFQALADDVGGLLDVTTGLASQSVKMLVAPARRKYEQYQMKRYPELAQLIDACNAQEASTAPSPELAADVLRIADRQMSEVADPSKRPLLVIFVDHFEKLQRDDRRNGEVALNHLIAALPQCLFVITGRNRLDWHAEARVFLPYHGPDWWPQLMPGVIANPRQHRMGMLSAHDTRLVFQRRAVRQGFTLGEAAVDRVVERTGGWPVHIDAICTLAAGLSHGTGAEVSAEALDRPLDDVVRRVQENLTERQARAFRGACLLPYFDDGLAAAAAGADEGDVASMRHHAMVEPNDDPRWPYRVHDTIRDIIRKSGPEVSGGWSANDWKKAAQRAIDYVEQKYREALAQENDLVTVRAAALGIRIAAENGTWADWFVAPAAVNANRPKSAFGAAPHEALALLLPRRATHPETDALLRFYAALEERDVAKCVEELTRIAGESLAVSRHARLWVAYKQRAAGHFDEAIEALRVLVVEHPWWRIPVGQIGITMSQGRRFADALRYAEEVDDKSQRYVRSSICLATGRLTDDRVLSWDRPGLSRRFAVELLGGKQRWAARTTGADLCAVDEALKTAVNMGHLGAQRSCHLARAFTHLAVDELFVEDTAELEILDSRAVRPSSHLAEVMALRALYTGSRSDAQRAFELWQAAPVHCSAWLPTETYLLELGQPVVPGAAQWPEPEEDVRRRWLGIAEGIIDRAKLAAS